MFAVALALSASCNPFDVYEGVDVYVRVPKGTVLSVAVLKSAEQICVYERDLITIYDQALPGADAYDPHLMFWGPDRRLYAASYFASEKIERLEAGTIHGYLNKHRAQRVRAYRNDLPPRYRLNLVARDDNGSGQMGNAVIDRMDVAADTKMVTLAIREANTKFVYPPEAPSEDPQVAKKTLRIPLCELNFFATANGSSVRARP